MLKNIVIAKGNANQFLDVMRCPDDKALEQRDAFVSDVSVKQETNEEILLDCAGLSLDFLEEMEGVNITVSLKKEPQETYYSTDVNIGEWDGKSGKKFEANRLNVTNPKKNAYARENFMSLYRAKQQMRPFTYENAIA